MEEGAFNVDWWDLRNGTDCTNLTTVDGATEYSAGSQTVPAYSIAVVQLHPGNGGDSGGGSTGELHAVGAGKCLDAYGKGTADGTKVDVWTCNGQANQQWTLA